MLSKYVYIFLRTTPESELRPGLQPDQLPYTISIELATRPRKRFSTQTGTLEN